MMLTGYSKMVRQPGIVRQIREARELGLEGEADRTRRAVPLLGDDDLGPPPCRFELGLPVEMILRARIRLAIGDVIFLAEDEQHHVGIRSIEPDFTQIGELRPACPRGFPTCRERLRERDDRHVEFLGQRP